MQLKHKQKLVDTLICFVTSFHSFFYCLQWKRNNAFANDVYELRQILYKKEVVYKMYNNATFLDEMKYNKPNWFS